MTEPKPDVGLYFACMPPLIVPLSQRAKDIMKLPEGVDCGLFLDDAEEVLALFGDGYIFQTLEEYKPTLIAPLTIDVFPLH